MKEIPLTKGKVAIIDDEDFEWLNQWNWYYGCDGYAFRTDCKNGRKSILMHRLILDTPRGMETDHINQNKLDNCRKNLRSATTSQNQANRPAPRNNTSGMKGVQWDKRANKWLAVIQFHGKLIYAGYFENINDAARAYSDKANELFGEFACAD